MWWSLVRLPLNCAAGCTAIYRACHGCDFGLLTFERRCVNNGPFLQANVVYCRTAGNRHAVLGLSAERFLQFQPGDSGTASPTSSPVSRQVRGWLLNCAMYAVRVWLLRLGSLQCQRSSQNNTCEQQHSTARHSSL